MKVVCEHKFSREPTQQFRDMKLLLGREEFTRKDEIRRNAVRRKEWKKYYRKGSKGTWNRLWQKGFSEVTLGFSSSSCISRTETNTEQKEKKQCQDVDEEDK